MESRAPPRPTGRLRIGLLLVAVLAGCDGARLPGGGLPGIGRLAQRLRLEESKLPMPSQPGPGSTNSTAALAQAIRRDIIFFERFATLLLRAAQRAIWALQEWCARSIGFPPRVMIVHLNGVILAEEDANAHAAGLWTGGRPELLADGFTPPLSDTSRSEKPGARRHGDGVINLARVDKVLTKAFSAHGARAVCLVINSPGGSPAQSSLIYQRLRALRKQHKRVPLLAFVEDSAVSGGYYIACAADEIVADPSSIVGSIGVISRGFGYVKAIKRQGVERRVQSAGASKSGLDPYMPQKSKDVKSQKRLLKEIHQNFIAAVREGRGDKLRPEAAARLHSSTAGGLGGCFGAPGKSSLRRLVKKGAGLYDGSVYSGEVGLEVGLVDGVGELRTELQKRYGRFVRLETIAEDERGLDYHRLLRWLL